MVVIRGKKINFDKSIGTYSKDEFTKLCNSLPAFIELPIKERNAKIKEVYGELTGNVKKIPKSRPGSNIHSNDEQSNGGNIGTKQGSNDGGKDIERKEDKAEVPKKLRSEEKKAEQ